MTRPCEGAGATTVLIVDADEEHRATLRGLFESFGARVYLAESGDQALRIIRAHRPTLILCDAHPHGLDGSGLVPQLRADPSLARIVAIAVTGRRTLAAMRASREAGFDGHVVKPVTREIVAALLGRHSAVRRRPGPA